MGHCGRARSQAVLVNGDKHQALDFARLMARPHLVAWPEPQGRGEPGARYGSPVSRRLMAI